MSIDILFLLLVYISVHLMSYKDVKKGPNLITKPLQNNNNELNGGRSTGVLNKRDTDQKSVLAGELSLKRTSF